MEARVLVLGGDGIGPEVADCGAALLRAVAAEAGITLRLEHDLLHGAAYDAHGTFCRDETLALAQGCDAVLVGAVGGPKWDGIVMPGGPEMQDGLMRLRAGLDTYAGLRPARARPALAGQTPFRGGHLDGADIMVLREMCGGVYFAPERGIGIGADGVACGHDMTRYAAPEIARIAHAGFALARLRRGRLTSVDKANVMQTGVLWRQVVAAIGRADYPDVTLEHVYADNAAYQMMRDPRQFDVILADNLFGDILSDLAGIIAGGLGTLPSASLNGTPGQAQNGPGIYEAVHGSAPDIAGRGIANPVGTLLSVGMLCEHALGQPDLAARIDAAVEAVLAAGIRTPDIGGASTSADVTRAVIDRYRGAAG
ncbi:MAG: 3-isopropylmalate dehydrogenase [Gemmobacter sp.]